MATGTGPDQWLNQDADTLYTAVHVINETNRKMSRR